MKNIIIWVLLGAMAVGGVLYYQQSQKAWEANNRVAELEKKLAEVNARDAKQEARNEDLRKELLSTKMDAVAEASQVQQMQQAATNKAAEKGTNLLTGMFKDPQMRNMIKNQQQMVMGPMIDKMYSGLMTNLNLSPEQSAALKDLLVKRSMIDAQMGVSLMGEDMTPDQRKALVDQAKTDKDALDSQMKQLLGDNGYSQLENWDKTQGERMMVNTFKDQLGADAASLSGDQESQLVQAMVEERGKFKFTTDFGDKSNFSGDFSSMFTEDKINQFSNESAQLMQNYLSRAQSILSPDQYKAFESSLNSQQQMQMVGLKMAAKLFGGK